MGGYWLNIHNNEPEKDIELRDIIEMACIPFTLAGVVVVGMSFAGSHLEPQGVVFAFLMTAIPATIFILHTIYKKNKHNQ